MEKCSICNSNPAAMICSCKNVPLWLDHLSIHIKEATGVHRPIPVDIYQAKNHVVNSAIDTNHDEFEKVYNLIKYKRKCSEDFNKYKTDFFILRRDI